MFGQGWPGAGAGGQRPAAAGAGSFQARPIQLGGMGAQNVQRAATGAAGWATGASAAKPAGYGQPAQQMQQGAAWAQKPTLSMPGKVNPAVQQGSALEVGDVLRIIVTGCADAVVGNYMRGSYTRTGMNHGKAVYKRDSKVAGSDVLIYYWDERDGVDDSGWWFAPEIGGSLVWAYHPNRQSRTVPTKGWKAPISAGVDPTVNIRGVTAQEGMALGGMQGGMQAMQGMQGGMQGGMGAAARPQVGGGLSQQQATLQQQQQLLQQRREAAAAGAAQQQELLQQRKEQEAVKRLKLQEQMMAAQAANQARAEEQKLKVKEEAMKRMEQQKQRTEEAKAMGNIMKIVRKLKAVTPETLEEVEAELATALVEDLEKCGALKTRVEADSTTGLKEAKERCEAVLEKRKKEEEARAELIKKRKEAEAKSTELLNELLGHIECAETAVNRLEEVQGTAEKADTPSKIDKAIKEMDQAKNEALEELKVSKEFIQTKRAAMVLPSMQALTSLLPKKEEEEETDEKKEAPPSLKDLAARLQSVDARCIKAKVTEGTLATKMKAKVKLIAIQSVFTKYDKDKDSNLSSKEVKAYAKGEFNFALPAKSVESIMMKIGGGDGGKGVPKEKFQALKVQVGLARDVARNDELKAERVKHEEKLLATKAELKARLDKAMLAGISAKTCISKVEESSKSIQKLIKELGGPEMLKKADDAEAEMKTAKEAIVEALKQAKSLEEDVEPEIKHWLDNELKKVVQQMAGFDSRIARVAELLPRFRTKAKSKDFEELQVLERQARGIFREFMRVKELDVDAAFKKIAGKKETILEDRLVEFFEARTEAAATAKQEAEDASDEEAIKKSKTFPKLSGLSDAQTTRLMPHLLDEDDDEGITKDTFMRLTWVYMKVVKALVMTEDLDIRKESLRKLEVGEVVRIIEGPVNMPDDKGDLERVKASAVNDSLEGWITIKGNKGTTYLEEVNGLYKVAKETILTENFELGGKSGKDDVKLRVGDCVQVREWPRKLPSGVVRMKCKAKTGAQVGSLGWVTVMGNSGAVFLEPVS